MAIVLEDPNEVRNRRLKMLLDTAQQAQQIQMQREELKMKREQMDPEYQRRQLAQTIALFNPEAAIRLAETGPYATGLPSKQGIPDYLSGRQEPTPRLTSSSIGMTTQGLTGLSQKVGGTTMKFGTPGMSEYDKANLEIHKQVVTESAKKRNEQQAGLNRTLAMEDVYLNQFGKSNEELKKFGPEIGQSGVGGWAARRYATIQKHLDELPQTKALDKLAKPIAQEIAAALEGRATDTDRQVQLDLLANTLAGPTEENITNATNNLLLMKAKGADIKPYVDRLNQSRLPI